MKIWVIILIIAGIIAALFAISSNPVQVPQATTTEEPQNDAQDTAPLQREESLAVPSDSCVFVNLHSFLTPYYIDTAINARYTITTTTDVEAYLVSDGRAELNRCVKGDTLDSSKSYLWVSTIDDTASFDNDGGLIIRTKETGLDTTVHISATELSGLFKSLDSFINNEAIEVAHRENAQATQAPPEQSQQET